MKKVRIHTIRIARAVLLALQLSFFTSRFTHCTSHAAVVTPASAADYLFSTPLRPAHIRGIVMGSPPAYYVPRSEDWDWLAEACEERNALATGSIPATNWWSTALVPEFGLWGLGETNRFYRWVTAVDAMGVTNVVVGYNLVTNSPAARGPGARIRDRPVLPNMGSDYWLDGDVDLLSGTVSIPGRLGLVTFTNVTHTLTYTNVVTNAFSLITMPMTNGTVSVHTNEWTAEVSVPVEYLTTNIYTAISEDYCQANPTGRFPRAFDGVPELPDHNTLPEQEVLSNYYARIRRTVRLGERGHTTYTNELYRVLEEYYDSDGQVYTNESPYADYFYFVRNDNNVNLRRSALPFSGPLTTKFSSALVTTGGAERVTIEAAYRVGTVFYYRHGANSTNLSATVISRVSFPEHLIVTGAYAQVIITNDALAQATADFEAAGHGIPALPALSDTSQTSETYRYLLPDYVIIYSIHPTSKFEDW